MFIIRVFVLEKGNVSYKNVMDETGRQLILNSKILICYSKLKLI
ncbi:hypothetical protein EHF_0149 [Ehrlichia japonica]|uniref:Uncharacterized protein n=1 Tax=Ehrlichia japonica TaxID=391036 RepID=X5H030_9RICK|nr:hypothetical protein EHF_0149 [Ehrlichia japonica]